MSVNDVEPESHELLMSLKPDGLELKFVTSDDVDSSQFEINHAINSGKFDSSQFEINHAINSSLGLSDYYELRMSDSEVRTLKQKRRSLVLALRLLDYIMTTSNANRSGDLTWKTAVG